MRRSAGNDDESAALNSRFDESIYISMNDRPLRIHAALD